MRYIAISLLAIAVAGPGAAQQQVDSSHASDVVASPDVPFSLPAEKLGANDLLGITVYDAPDLTRSVRVDDDGTIRLPLVRQHIQAAGLTPDQLESVIATTLVDEQIMVSPTVAVTVVEYHSRPITVIGAVRSPTTFQAAGPVTLLDAITRAGGIGENAGSEILVTHTPSTESSVGLTERIPIHSLLNLATPASNLRLVAGDTVRVPEAGRIFVVGDVKRPGPFAVTDDSESSILKALSIAGGLDSFASHTAYIYRTDVTNGHHNEIPVELKKILARKAPDVPLYASDMLYIPNAFGLKVSARVLEIAGGVGIGVASLLIYATR